MDPSPYPKRAPYYRKLPTETFVRYLRRVFSAIIAMYPYAKTHGIRYYFDTDFRRHISHNRRRRKKDTIRRKRAGAFNSKSFKAKLKADLIKRDGRICKLCKQRFYIEELTIDHVVRLFSGGTNELENLQLLCVPCHVEKTREEHRQEHLKRNAAND